MPTDYLTFQVRESKFQPFEFSLVAPTRNFLVFQFQGHVVEFSVSIDKLAKQMLRSSISTCAKALSVELFSLPKPDLLP